MRPTRPEPQPATRSGEAWRYVAAVLGGLLVWVAEASGSRVAPGLVLLDLLLGAVAVIALRWRRRYPARIALLVTMATAVAGTASAAWVIAFVSLVTTRRWRAVVPVAVLGIATSYVYDGLRPTEGDTLPWWALLVFSVLFTGVLLAFGLYVGARRELWRVREETFEREQATRVEEARRSERARIAREMHDVLAHRISLVSLHAGAMTYRADLDPAELRHVAGVVQENAHRALVDLRDVLGVLRDPEPAGTSAGLAPPQPTLAALPELVEEARASGTPVRVLQQVADLRAVPTTVGRTAYRIVQEALTNARKHAPGASVVLTLSGGPGSALAVELRNPLLPVPAAVGPAAPSGVATTAVPGAGVGLVGLAERAELAGGGLEHGVSGTSYRVSARLPWPA